MSTTGKPKNSSKATMVDVVVVVNHDDLRRGERGEVELTDVVRARLEGGYLRLAEDDEQTLSGLPAPELGAGARSGGEPRGFLLGVDGIPGSMVVGTGGSGDNSASAGGTDTAGA
jgi:hypothetical protein